jgi:hypothetical protein
VCAWSRCREHGPPSPVHTCHMARMHGGSCACCLGAAPLNVPTSHINKAVNQVSACVLLIHAMCNMAHVLRMMLRHYSQGNRSRLTHRAEGLQAKWAEGSMS